MDENHQDKTEGKLIATENKSQLPPFSPEDEKEAQKELDRLRKRLRENENGAVNVNRKLKRKRTGFEDKTLWDKLNLFGTLAIPLIIALATFGFGLLQVHLADVQHQTDQQQALDQQQATILQTYIDNIQDLLLNHNLLKSKFGDGVATLARARTLTALQRLDSARKGYLVQFIYDAGLIGFQDHNYKTHGPIIDLSNAPLTGAELDNAHLIGAHLNGVYLSGAFLNGAFLYNADLSNATLNGTYLSGAYLDGANLSQATLVGADLYNAVLSDASLNQANLSQATLNAANLTGADLTGADLSEADLSSTSITQKQLDDLVSTCKGAILPPGLTCHRNQ